MPKHPYNDNAWECCVTPNDCLGIKLMPSGYVSFRTGSQATEQQGPAVHLNAADVREVIAHLQTALVKIEGKT